MLTATALSNASNTAKVIKALKGDITHHHVP